MMEFYEQHTREYLTSSGKQSRLCASLQTVDGGGGGGLLSSVPSPPMPLSSASSAAAVYASMAPGSRSSHSTVSSSSPLPMHGASPPPPPTLASDATAAGAAYAGGGYGTVVDNTDANSVISRSSVEATSANDAAPPPRKIYTNDLPVLESFTGPYGFDLYRPLCEEIYEASETKPSTSFFYFKDDSGWTNLYAKKAPTWWNLSYWCQSPPPDGCVIRLVPVYGTSDKKQEVIQRCFEDFVNFKCPGTARYSIIRVGHSMADYVYDPNTERLCVMVPYEKPKEGCEYSQFNGKFMCFNSCLYNGGQGNKKPLYLIITLEKVMKDNRTGTQTYEVLGRQCIKFRSCACPKRDKDNSERRQFLENSSIPRSQMGMSCKSAKRQRTECKGKRNKEMPQSLSPAYSNCTPMLNSTLADLTNSSLPHYLKHPLNDPASMLEYGFHPTSQLKSPAVVSIANEPYQLVAVPLKLPGAAQSILQMRHAIMSTYYMCQQRLEGNGKKFKASKSDDQSEDNKLDVELGMYEDQGENKMTNLDSTLAHINRVELEAAMYLEQQHANNTSNKMNSDSTNSPLSLNGQLNSRLSGNDSLSNASSLLTDNNNNNSGQNLSYKAPPTSNASFSQLSTDKQPTTEYSLLSGYHASSPMIGQQNTSSSAFSNHPAVSYLSNAVAMAHQNGQLIQNSPQPASMNSGGGYTVSSGEQHQLLSMMQGCTEVNNQVPKSSYATYHQQQQMDEASNGCGSTEEVNSGGAPGTLSFFPFTNLGSQVAGGGFDRFPIVGLGDSATSGKQFENVVARTNGS